MKKEFSAVLEGKARMSLREFPLPELGEDEGLLRVEMAGVCGSDYSWYHEKVQLPYYPVILGHEILGRIEKLGKKAADRLGLAEGDRVVVESRISCNACRYCLAGNYVFCDKELGYGTTVPCDRPPHLWGAYGEYLYIAPGARVHKVSESVPAEAAVLTCGILANGLRWVHQKGGVGIGDAVVVQGVGQQGLATVIASTEAGAGLIIATGVRGDERRLRLAREYGAHHTVNMEEPGAVERILDLTGGRGADVVVDVTSSPASFQTALDLVRKQGTVVSAGLKGTRVETPVVLDKIVLREVRV
ncbi:MAG: zinc-binding dehydrogenase, partial [Nitrospinota bacterium]